MEELDAVGPWEVLSYWARGWPEDRWRVFLFSRCGGPVACAKGLTVLAEHAEETRPPVDVLLYPGGPGVVSHLSDPAHLDWVRAIAGGGALMTSVCTGSLVYAAAGLLSGKTATSHWAALEQLGRLDPSITVRGDERFVDDGAVITAAGVSAGIDMALHLVARLAGTSRAGEVRRGIQYDPAPPGVSGG
ncbi:MAG: hypothetical protein NVSMB29_02440 [Candidatus Dormibacteria bacterium]